ncbi:glycosyltransferase [Streptococcus suis]
MKVLMIIPAYTEEENIIQTVQGMIDYKINVNFQLDSVLINDGSKDSTKEILFQKKLNAFPPVKNLVMWGFV